MSWTCPGHYKVHVHGRDSPGHPVHGHCPVPLPALPPAIVFSLSSTGYYSTLISAIFDKYSGIN